MKKIFPCYYPGLVQPWIRSWIATRSQSILIRYNHWDKGCDVDTPCKISVWGSTTGFTAVSASGDNKSLLKMDVYGNILMTWADDNYLGKLGRDAPYETNRYPGIVYLENPTEQTISGSANTAVITTDHRAQIWGSMCLRELSSGGWAHAGSQTPRYIVRESAEYPQPHITGITQLDFNRNFITILTDDGFVWSGRVDYENIWWCGDRFMVYQPNYNGASLNLLVQETSYTLNVNSTGTEAVAIAGAPATYGGTTNYSKTGIASGTSITLAAPATSGAASFASWSGCTSSSGTSCTVSMVSDKTVTVIFKRNITSILMLLLE